MSNTNYTITADVNGAPLGWFATVSIDFKHAGNDEIATAFMSMIERIAPANATITVRCDRDSYGSDGFVCSWRTDINGIVIPYSEVYSRGGFEIPADAVVVERD